MLNVLMRAFGRPQGRLGGIIMASTNEGCGAWVIDLLEVGPNDNVLEVGFGPGVVIQHLAKLASEGYVAGIDPSREMVQQLALGTRLHQNGRVDLQRGSVDSLPFDDGSFDKALAVRDKPRASGVLVLQQPISGDLPADATSFCFLVSKGPEGGELQAKPNHIYETCDATVRRWMHVSGDQFAQIRPVCKIEAAFARPANFLQILCQALFRIVVVDRFVTYPHNVIGRPPQSRVHDNLRATLQNTIIQLQFLHACHVSVRLQPVSVQDGSQAVGSGSDNMCAAHGSTRVVNGANVDAELLLELGREPLALGWMDCRCEFP
jgi:SAM-dependent methyltransferase